MKFLTNSLKIAAIGALFCGVASAQDSGTRETQNRAESSERAARQRTQRILELTDKARLETQERLSRVNPLNLDVWQVDSNVESAKTKINVDLDDVTLGEALKKICSDAKVEYEFDKSIQQDQKVTLKAKNVRLATALNVIAEQLNTGWRIQSKLDEKNKGKLKITYVFGTKPNTFNSANFARVFRIPDNTTSGLSGYVYEVGTTSTRKSFNCPHCKKDAQINTSHEPAKCGQCNRLFQRDWKVCPYDGTKRPKENHEVSHCPFCGKKVSANGEPKEE